MIRVGTRTTKTPLQCPGPSPTRRGPLGLLSKHTASVISVTVQLVVAVRAQSLAANHELNNNQAASQSVNQSVKSINPSISHQLESKQNNKSRSPGISKLENSSTLSS